MDTLDEEKIRIQAEQARQILENPLFERYIETKMKNVVSSWASAGDLETRERLWMMQAVMREFTNGLKQYIYSAQQQQSEDENE